MDTVGDGTGNIEMAVDGSTTPVLYKVTCPVGETYELHRVIVTVRDTGSFDTGGFGNGSALTNGIQVLTNRPTRAIVEKDKTLQLPIKRNSDWGAYMYDAEVHTFGTGDQVFHGRYTFDQDGEPLKLGPGDSLIVSIRDDCTTVNEMHVRIGMTRWSQSGVYA